MQIKIVFLTPLIVVLAILKDPFHVKEYSTVFANFVSYFIFNIIANFLKFITSNNNQFYGTKLLGVSVFISSNIFVF